MSATTTKPKRKTKKRVAKAKTAGEQLVSLVGVKEADSKKTKPDHPEVVIDPRTLSEYFEQRAIAKTAAKAADDILAPLIPEFEEARVQASRKEGECISSLDVNGTSTFCQPHKYGKIEGKKIRRIRAIFGDDFDGYFDKVVTGSLNMKFLGENPDIAKVLFRALAQACKAQGIRPKEVLNVSRVLAPTKKFSTARVLDKAVEAKAEKAKEAGLVKPASPTLTKPQRAKKKK